MPKASLLLREQVSTSLSSIVAKSQIVRPPFSEYTLSVTSTHLNLILIYKPYIKPLPHDEGIESDLDSISLVSSDDSCTSSTCLVADHVIKHRENDSANGSSSSDTEEPITAQQKECYQLCDVLCYTDVKFPKILVFVIKDHVWVFSFDNLNILQQFYTSFNTLKAVTNQRTYAQNNTKYNLLHRTDQNGITHIEISKQPSIKLPELNSNNILSINTPDPTPVLKKPTRFLDDSNLGLQSINRSNTKPDFYPSYTLKPKSNLKDENLKVWKSAEDLLNGPKRPERRKKGKAPQPPQNIMKGQYIRVAVDPKKTNEIPSQTKNLKTFGANIQTFTPNWSNIQTPSPLILTTVPKKNKLPDLKPKVEQQNWTNSVPRLLKKPRSKSETRQVQYSRYIDTTKTHQLNSTTTISNRLFGLSQKLKEFGSNVSTRNFFEPERRNSLGEMSYKVGNESNLKSVIKKDDKKHKNEKKVTFSAYATVQVV